MNKPLYGDLPMYMKIASILLLAGSASAGSLEKIQVINDQAPDCSTLESIVKSVTKECKTDDAKAIAIYNFMRFVNYHHAYPREKGGIPSIKLINVYGWSLCGGQHSALSSLWEKAGFKWRFRGWKGHTTVEVGYGGGWHFLDTFLKFYTWKKDPASPSGWTIASQEDINANPKLVSDLFAFDDSRAVWYLKDQRLEVLGGRANWLVPAFMVCGDSMPGVISGCKGSKNSGSPRAWMGIKFDAGEYTTDVNLSPGYALTFDWKAIPGAHYFSGKPKSPRHSCGDKDYRNCPAIGPLLEPYRELNRSRTWSNGTLLYKPDLKNSAFLDGLKEKKNVKLENGELAPEVPAQPGVIVVEMQSPYVVAKASGSLTFKEPDEGAKLEISTDQGKKWMPAPMGDFSKVVAGSYRYWVRFTFSKPLTGIEVSSIIQHNQEALPYLAPGKNTITVNSKNPDALGENRLVITYGYYPGSRNYSAEQMIEKNYEIAKAHAASWSKELIVVQKEVASFPYTFEILVPTPKGHYPVYPRMAFLRREVLAKGSKPQPTPVAPSQPTLKDSETLATLPFPFNVGTQPPVPKPPRPTEKAVRELTNVTYVDKKGTSYDHHWLKWHKDNSNPYIMLVSGDLSNLPGKDSIAAAQLVFQVSDAHEKANMQVGAVVLKAPFEKGKAYDFRNLGANLGTTVVRSSKGKGPFDPPLTYEIDVTKALRRWAGGEKAYGFAIRIFPNRSVDDGWTVRFTPAKDKVPQLVIKTFKATPKE